MWWCYGRCERQTQDRKARSTRRNRRKFTWIIFNEHFSLYRTNQLVIFKFFSEYFLVPRNKYVRPSKIPVLIKPNANASTSRKFGGPNRSAPIKNCARDPAKTPIFGETKTTGKPAHFNHDSHRTTTRSTRFSPSIVDNPVETVAGPRTKRNLFSICVHRFRKIVDGVCLGP